MIFRHGHGSANVTTLVERRTRYALLFKNNGRRSKPLMNRLMTFSLPCPHPRASP